MFTFMIRFLILLGLHPSSKSSNSPLLLCSFLAVKIKPQNSYVVFPVTRYIVTVRQTLYRVGCKA